MPRLHAWITPGHVVIQLGGRQQLVALGVGLHEAVLDAVVHHLREVARADRAGVDEALLARPSGAARRTPAWPLDVLVVAAGHQAVAVLRPQTPPETPQSTKPMPCSSSSSALRSSSV